MKRLLLFLVFAANIISNGALAQTVTLQQKLYYTCKVWGFAKYYHSNVSNCTVNWDSVLISVLPLVRAATDNSKFNDALDTMLSAAGPMALATTYFPDTLAAELKRNRDWGWIDASPILRSDVQIQLDTIRNNFRPHANCWVEVNPPGHGGYLHFPHDDPGVGINTFRSYPDGDQRQLIFYKYWNIVNYFYPYKYVIDAPWDTTLYNYVMPMDTVSSSSSFFLQILKVATALDDAHTFGLTQSSYYHVPGIYEPGIYITYADSQYVVLRSLEPSINPGDIIISLDGLSTRQWEDSLKQYYSSGNPAVLRRSVCLYMMARSSGSDSATLVIEDSTGADNTFRRACGAYVGDPFFSGFHYPADSLDTINWTMMPCGAGYINIGNISNAGVDSAYAVMQNAPAIIIDKRNYPRSNAVGYLYQLLYANTVPTDNLTMPDVTYPGTYYWQHDTLFAGSATPYAGLVILLINEEAISSAEYECMGFSAEPNAIKIGSQTDGADGSITSWQLTTDIRTGFSSLGVYYPNGDSTQRIGIVPDSVVLPTIVGIRHGDDEVLDKALQMACATASVPTYILNKTAMQVFPNPACDYVTVTGITTDATISIADVLGNVLIHKAIIASSKSITLDISWLTPGVYFVTETTSNGRLTKKFIKEPH